MVMISVTPGHDFESTAIEIIMPLLMDGAHVRLTKKSQAWQRRKNIRTGTRGIERRRNSEVTRPQRRQVIMQRVTSLRALMADASGRRKIYA